MTRSRKGSRSAAGVGTDAQALVTRMMDLQADAGLTIAMRMPILLKGAMGDSRGQREASKAVVEKVSAVMESSVAATQAAALFWWGMALNPMQHMSPTGFSDAATKAAHSALEPFSKRTRANASRLGSRRG